MGSSNTVVGIYGADSIVLRPGGASGNSTKGLKLSASSLLP